MRRTRYARKQWILSSSVGAAFVLGGCDPTVRETVLGGVATAANGLTSTFIQAFFESLLTEEQPSDAPTTVMNDAAFDAIFA